MPTSAVAKVIAGREHSDIAEHILSHLGWTDLLNASAVCTSLNDIVTTSPPLQLTLRETYHDPEQCLKQQDLSPAEQLARIMDVQQRWAKLDPKRVEWVKHPGGAMRVSGGLLVIAHSNKQQAPTHGDKAGSIGAQDDGEGLMDLGEDEDEDENDDSRSDDSMSYYSPFRAWSIYDYRKARDAPVYDTPCFVKCPGFRFASFDISFEENLVAIARFPELDGDACDVFFYLLDPAGSEDEVPIQHPEAIAKGYLTVPVSCTDTVHIVLTPGAIYVQSCFTGSIWNWRTGEQTMSGLNEGLGVFSPWSHPFSSTEVLTGGGHNPTNTRESASADQVHHMHFIKAGRSGNNESRQLRLPRLRSNYFDRRPEGRTDLTTKLVLIHNDNIGNTRMEIDGLTGEVREDGMEAQMNDSYTVILRSTELQKRLWSEPSSPPLPLEQCGDIADMEFYYKRNAVSGMHGHRVLTVELGRDKVDGSYRHNLRMANYRFESSTAEMAHPWPLGSRFATPPAVSKSAGGTTTTTGNITVSLTQAQDWGHDDSPVTTGVFIPEQPETTDYTSARMSRPGTSCELVVPGDMNFVGNVIIDDERAYIPLISCENKMEDMDSGGYKMWSESTYHGLLILMF